MIISKKKSKEFDNCFKLFEYNNFYIDIELFRNLFISDFYEQFLSYTENKIKKLLEMTNDIIIHTNINVISIQDTYHYDKIIMFCKLLHKFTKNIKNIFIYGSSLLFNNFINLINITLGININEKIIFSNDFTKIKLSLESEYKKLFIQ